MKYKLIVSDIDGTLVDDNQNISPYTKKQVNAFIERGGIFTLATGRIEEATKRFYNKLNLQHPAILYNGAKIVNLSNCKTYFDSQLEKEHAYTAFKLLKELPWAVMAYKGGNIYVSHINKVVEAYMKKDGVNCIEVGDLSRYFKEPPTKILIIGDDILLDDFAKRYESSCKIKPNTVKSEQSYLEILPLGTSKGTALEKLCTILKISLNETIAIGDHLNDIDMIKRAGLGVAMENAHPLVKEAADHICLSNEKEGVADIVGKVLAMGQIATKK